MKFAKRIVTILIIFFITLYGLGSIQAWNETDLPLHIFSLGGYLENGEIGGLTYIAKDSVGNIYVSDVGTKRIQKFNSSGEFVMKFGSYGTGDGQFISNSGIAVDSLGNIYVSDVGTNHIQKFNSSGQLLLKFGSSGSGDGQLKTAYFLAIDSEDNIYVSDSGNHRIQKFDSLGNYLSKFGVNGIGNGQFKTPLGIALNQSGEIFVSDSGNHRIQKFDSSGVYQSQFGSLGSGDGQLNYPYGIDLDSNGYIFVANYLNNRIEKFSPSGIFDSKIGIGQVSNPFDLKIDSAGNIYVAQYFKIKKFNSSGDFISQIGGNTGDDAKFISPKDIASDSDGNIYVVDSGNYRVQKFNSSGKFLLKFGTNGTEDGQFGGMYGLAIDKDNNVYVADIQNKRIQKFNSNGEFIMKFGSSGTAEGQFANFSYLATDNSGNIYVTDTYNHRIQKFDSSGNFIFTIGWGVDDGASVFQKCTSGCQIGKSGSGDGQFNTPFGLYVDNSGNIYVANYLNNRIEKFNSDGQFVAKIGTSGTADGQLKIPEDVFVDSNGFIYVNDYGNKRIQKLSPSGEFVLKFGSEGKEDGKFSYPSGIIIDNNFNFFIADTSNHRIQKFSFDRLPPVGSVSINQGSEYTTTPSVTLSLSASDNLSSVTSMMICSNETFTGCEWEPYQTVKPWTFDNVLGTKTIYVKYKDTFNTESLTYSDTVVLHIPSVSITDIGKIQNIPNINPLTMYFTSQSATIKGVTQSLSRVFFVYGGNTYTTVADINGNFSISLNVLIGTNTIEYYSKDPSNNSSESKTLSLIVGLENFPVWLLEKLGVVIETEEEDNLTEENEQIEEESELEENEQESKQNEKEDNKGNAQIIQFLNPAGNPTVGAKVEINGREYITDNSGKIVVLGLEAGKNYKVKIEHNGQIYQSEVLGAMSTNKEIVVKVSEGEVKEFNWRTPLYIFLGLILLLITFLLLFRDHKKENFETNQQQ